MMRRVPLFLSALFVLTTVFVLLPQAKTIARAASVVQNDSEAFWKQAGDYYNAGRYAEAIETYKQYIRLRPNDAEARYWLGSSYYKLKQYTDAAVASREAVRVKTHDP